MHRRQSAWRLNVCKTHVLTNLKIPFVIPWEVYGFLSRDPNQFSDYFTKLDDLKTSLKVYHFNALLSISTVIEEKFWKIFYSKGNYVIYFWNDYILFFNLQAGML